MENLALFSTETVKDIINTEVEFDGFCSSYTLQKENHEYFICIESLKLVFAREMFFMMENSLNDQILKNAVISEENYELICKNFFMDNHGYSNGYDNYWPILLENLKIKIKQDLKIFGNDFEYTTAYNNLCDVIDDVNDEISDIVKKGFKQATDEVTKATGTVSEKKLYLNVLDDIIKNYFKEKERMHNNKIISQFINYVLNTLNLIPGEFSLSQVHISDSNANKSRLFCMGKQCFFR